ncbi:uncharacterized protein N7479_009502 [Penicillium vulpinum]|uniref:NlpC/P60 domain-containing protein n=1 Tax=Penicillium vulpinum TaxID=29845 RepID=A0A1V6RYQ0_9EURO|nr:uncharacterized protein N7479_009502 [Penicillium vulpinum]KAJ5951089.1 hypothetical protein N7479_009502 [Penicillium vulpinum]OQE06907.1 hypothetical protein PENVUL_c016G06790 [Penicillium vulpinum]
MFSTFATQVTLALILGAANAFPSSNKSTKFDARISVQPGYINVAVATLWTDSSKPRAIDEPALANPVQIEKWLNDMNVTEYRDLTSNSRTQTQALYGARVDILNYESGWYEIAVPGEATPKNNLGYPGWVPASQVSLDQGYGKLQSSKPFATINKAATVPLYRDPSLTSKLMEIVYDTRLPVLKKRGSVIEVAVPDGGSAYLFAHDTTIYKSVSEIPYPTSLDLINTAKLFIGLPYLWGGMSGFAFDCSGLTHTIYHSHGISIGRDADAQADFTGHGIQVTKADLQPADLMFYASNLSDPNTIYHVAMYIGEGEMVEAYDAGTPVRITTARFGEQYWGAERFLH